MNPNFEPIFISRAFYFRIISKAEAETEAILSHRIRYRYRRPLYIHIYSPQLWACVTCLTCTRNTNDNLSLNTIAHYNCQMLGAVLNYLLHFRYPITNRTMCVLLLVVPKTPQTPQLHLY